MNMEKWEECKAAKAKIVEGSLTIWNARLDSLVQTGDIKAILNQLVNPAETGFLDNCDCGCGEYFPPYEFFREFKPTVKK